MKRNTVKSSSNEDKQLGEIIMEKKKIKDDFITLDELKKELRVNK